MHELLVATAMRLLLSLLLTLRGALLAAPFRFETAEQRAAHGWPAERPEKNVRKKGRGVTDVLTVVTKTVDSGVAEAPSTGDVGCAKMCTKNATEGDADGARTCSVMRRAGKRYVLLLTSGLANRLRTLLGFKLVATLTHGELLICWKPGVSSLFSSNMLPCGVVCLAKLLVRLHLVRVAVLSGEARGPIAACFICNLI